MTEDQATRTSSGICPPWCAAVHGEKNRFHETERLRVALAGQAGSVRTKGIRVGAADEVVVHASWYGGESIPDSDVYVPPEVAAQLAALVEILSNATPKQHREIAAAIRQAVAQITGAEAQR